MNKKKKSGRAGRIFLTVACILLALLLVALLLGLMVWERLLDGIERVEGTQSTLAPEVIASIENETDPTDEPFTGEVLRPEDVTWSTEPVETIGKDDKNIINILLIGQDRRPGQGRQRSDSMILCTVNKEKKTLTMTSFLRDLYVQIPGYMDNRLNATYAFGGMPLLNETLALNFGIHIDGNIEVDFSGFREIVDIMGGVRIKLTNREAHHLNVNNDWALSAGENLLNGEEALAYARIRKIDNDFGRTDRQRKVLTQLLEQSRSMTISQATTLLTKVLDLITTDMDNSQITSYVWEMLPLLKDLKIVTQHIPAEGAYKSAWIRGMAVLVPDLEQNRQILRESLLD
ncbi:MAG: LCP family protein [Oscillospiraceae bacterium]|nr:LCP family protein [Oscillospiraceae bacterium]